MKTRVCSSLSQLILQVKHFVNKHGNGVAFEPRMIALFSIQGCQIVALHFIILNFLLVFHFFTFFGCSPLFINTTL
jgi:hypothetical protein